MMCAARCPVWDKGPLSRGANNRPASPIFMYRLPFCSGLIFFLIHKNLRLPVSTHQAFFVQVREHAHQAFSNGTARAIIWCGLRIKARLCLKVGRQQVAVTHPQYRRGWQNLPNRGAAARGSVGLWWPLDAHARATTGEGAKGKRRIHQNNKPPSARCRDASRICS